MLRYDFSASTTNPLVSLIALTGRNLAPLPSTFNTVTIGGTLGIDANGNVGFGGTIAGATPTSAIPMGWANGTQVIVNGLVGPAPNSTWQSPSLASSFQYGDANSFAVSSKPRLSTGLQRSVVCKNNVPVAVKFR